MSARERITKAAVLLAIAGSACVEARSDDPLGNAQFVASSALGSQDYAPAGPAAAKSGAGIAGAGVGPLAPPAAAAAAGSGSSLPPTAATMPAGPGIGGAPASERPGPSPAAGSGATGRAGAPAAAVAGGPAPSGAAGGSAAAGAAAPAAAVGALTIDFKTVNQGGTYAPRNVGAVWIQTASGMFVKTLERWAGVRANHLSLWNTASGGWGGLFGGGNTADMMDAVSRATLRSHEMHHVTWNMKDSKGQVVPDGMYNVVVECTEDNFFPGANGTVMFMKGPAPQMVSAPDKAPWSGFSLKYQP